MRLTSVEIRGWMPFAKRVKLDLPSGPIAIVGTHSGDPRRSNRAGKTSFLEAITWCLYGVHRKRLDDAIINRECDECVVTVELGDMRVMRKRARGSSTKLEITTYDVLSGMYVVQTGDAGEQALLSYLGLGLQDYLATLCFRQGDVESIITRTAGERLALVSEWLQQSRWLDAKKLQAAKTNAAVQELALKRESMQRASVELITDGLRDAMQNEIIRLKKQQSEQELRMAAVRTEMQERIDAHTALQNHADLERLRQQAAEAREGIGNRVKLRQQLEEAEANLQIARAVAGRAKDALAELQQVRRTGFDGTCPVTCEQCPVSDEVTESARKAKELLLQRMSQNSAAGDVVITRHAEYEGVREAVNAAERKFARYQALVEQGKQLSAKTKLTVEEARAVPPVDALEKELAELQQSYVRAANRIGEVEAMLRTAASFAQKHAELEKEVAAAEVQSQVSQLALRAIASVPAKIAAQQLGELEREANFLLAGAGVSLRFSWARELADKAPICEGCGHVFKGQRGDKCPSCSSPRGRKTAQELELLCEDGSGVEEDVRFNSGGTRALVGASIRLAASAMLRRLRSTQAAWAIVDEPFGSLDAENREQLARTFAGMLGSVGFEQALVVSHDPVLLGALPHRIVVDKDGSASTLRLE